MTWVREIRDRCLAAQVAFFFKLLCTKSRPTAVDASTGRLVLAA
jgi:protein gp37